MKFQIDIECYPNYFLIQFFQHTGTEAWEPIGKYRSFEQDTDGLKTFDAQELFDFVTHKDVTLVSFNGNDYDIPMMMLALQGASCAELKKVSDYIIHNGVKGWQFYDEFNVQRPDFIDHIDLIQVAPGQASLKIYMGRMHSRRMQDLPYHPDQYLTRDEQAQTKLYCRNDLKGTAELAETLLKQIELRQIMGKEYGIDLRSKSDAQIAEAVLRAEYKRITGETVPSGSITYKKFKYKPPKYVTFTTEPLQEALALLTEAEFHVKQSSGHVIMPDEIEDLTIEIGSTRYKLGLGGLHSQESEIAHFTDDESLLMDWDVASYYPSMIVNMNIQPPAFGKHFQPIYQDILQRRLDAKKAGNKVVADSLKITLNGTFGKLANQYSRLYTPSEMLRTTVTGQLSLLMLIELFEEYGIPVVSANTDGIVVKCPRTEEAAMRQIIAAWEKRTRLTMESSTYKALYSKDVNNYIAIKENGSVKCKGIYAEPGLMKNPTTTIVTEAVVEWLTNGILPEDTIRYCNDIRKFVSVRTVRGGAEKDGEPIGKAIRWYYATGVEGTINYITSGNTVPKTLGAKPCMTLPDEFPDDVALWWYVDAAKKMLWDIGALPRPVLDKIPRKNSKAWKALFEEGKVVLDENDKSIWNEEIQYAAEVAAGSRPVELQQAQSV